MATPVTAVEIKKSAVSVDGFVGKTPELLMFPDKNGGPDNPALYFTVGVSTTTINDTGFVENTDWYKCALFGDRATHFDGKILQGQMVHIEGGGLPDEYINDDGISLLSTKVQVKVFQILRQPRAITQ